MLLHNRTNEIVNTKPIISFVKNSETRREIEEIITPTDFKHYVLDVTFPEINVKIFCIYHLGINNTIDFVSKTNNDMSLFERIKENEFIDSVIRSLKKKNNIERLSYQIYNFLRHNIKKVK